ncbi:MAG: hypothetical protein ACJ8AW_03710 [Rhodopila sp.]
MADGLVEKQFHRNTRVGAGQDGGERLLLRNRVLLQDCKVFRKGCQLLRNKARIAGHKLLERRVRRQRRLRAGVWRCREKSCASCDATEEAAPADAMRKARCDMSAATAELVAMDQTINFHFLARPNYEAG